jgi:hypothetical protein
MTLQNCLLFLEKYKEGMTNPEFNSSQKAQSKKNYEMMKLHLERDRRHQVVETPLEEPKKEVKKSGKKSKG